MERFYFCILCAKVEALSKHQNHKAEQINKSIFELRGMEPVPNYQVILIQRLFLTFLSQFIDVL